MARRELHYYLSVPVNSFRGSDYYNTESKVHEFRSMFEYTTDKFDWSRRQGCCNVISISLYILGNDNVELLLTSLRKYLRSIERSIKNIQVNLPLWVVRLYFGSSVEKSIMLLRTRKDLLDREKELFVAYDFIIRHEQVELYVIPEEILDAPEEIRTARFFPLIDPKVNVCIVREADGTVTNLDCHNILFFFNSPRHLFYLPNYGKINCFRTYNNENGRKEPPYLFSGYSGWLVVYKSVLRREFFLHHQNVYDLLAGLFGTKLKIKPGFYQSTIQELKDRIDMLKTKSLPVSVSDGDVIPKIFSKVVLQNGGIYYLSHDMFISEFDDKKFNFTSALRLGFDELLLLDLCKEIISVPLSPNSLIARDVYAKITVLQISITEKTDTDSLTKIRSLIIGDEIHTIQFGKYDREKSIDSTIDTLFVKTQIIRRDEIMIQKLKKYMEYRRYNVFDLLYFIDSLLTNINDGQEAFDVEIIVPYDGMDFSYKLNILLNTPYTPTPFYDFSSIEKSSGGKRCKKYNYKSYKIRISHKKRRLRTKKRQNRHKNRKTQT